MHRPYATASIACSVLASLALMGSVASCASASPGPSSPATSDEAGTTSTTPGTDPTTNPTDPPGPVVPPVVPGGEPGGTMSFGAPYTGGEFHLGPVEYEETQWHNACAPGTKYSSAVQKVQGRMLAGLWGGLPNVGGYCDSCIRVNTDKGKSAVLRVVTYGDTTRNSIDVSPEAFAVLNSGESPRKMTWQFTDCADTGKPIYELQAGAHEYWTSLWVRNVRLPVAKVEVKSKNHATFVALARGGDGTLTDGAGFGKGPFTLRVTSVDGKTFEDTFDWPADGVGGKLFTGAKNF